MANKTASLFALKNPYPDLNAMLCEEEKEGKCELHGASISYNIHLFQPLSVSSWRFLFPFPLPIVSYRQSSHFQPTIVGNFTLSREVLKAQKLSFLLTFWPFLWLNRASTRDKLSTSRIWRAREYHSGTYEEKTIELYYRLRLILDSLKINLFPFSQPLCLRK